MAIKETPINLRTYFRLMQEDSKTKREEAIQVREDLLLECKAKHEEIKSNKDNYKVNLDEYPEFVENKYINGQFLRVAKGVMVNKEGDYELVGFLYDVYTLAVMQKDIYNIEKDIALYDKLLALNLKQYTEILRTYYTAVHEKMILEGNGYSLGQIGWLCINRCVIRKRSRPMLDFAATKKREAELRAQGKRIYNKEEAEWCKKNGIDYKAEDKRVFKNDEHCYEVPLIGCKLPGGSKMKFEISDYRSRDLRGKPNQTIIEECNSDTKKICRLKLDLRTKLTLCDQTDKILYTKFIRNENQESVAAVKTNRKD